MNKNKGFSLMELLAVIVIVGILLLVAIPAVTNYLSNARKDSYVETVKRYIDAVRPKIVSKEYSFNNKNTIFYVPVSCIKTENAGVSPNGEFLDAYVVVTYDGEKYTYYFAGYDEENIGMTITSEESINNSSIKTNIDKIDKTTPINGKTKVGVINKATCEGPPLVLPIEDANDL